MAYAGPEFCEMGQPPPIICGSYRGSLDIQDVISVLGTRMVGIGDREGVA